MSDKTKAADGKNETASSKDTINAIVSANGGNIDPLKKDIKKGYEKVKKLEEERQAINDNINAVKSDLEAKGIKKKAFNMALQYMAMSPDDREGFDIAYDIVREALGEPVNPTLFDE